MQSENEIYHKHDTATSHSQSTLKEDSAQHRISSFKLKQPMNKRAIKSIETLPSAGKMSKLIRLKLEIDAGKCSFFAKSSNLSQSKIFQPLDQNEKRRQLTTETNSSQLFKHAAKNELRFSHVRETFDPSSSLVGEAKTRKCEAEFHNPKDRSNEMLTLARCPRPVPSLQLRLSQGLCKKKATRSTEIKRHKIYL